MHNKSVTLNAFLNSVRSLLGVIFPLITFPYVSRVLSVDGIGKYNFSSSIVSYFSLIAALGISTYAVREGAKYRQDKKKIQRFASEILTINVYSAILAYLLLFSCLIFFVKLHSYIACILIYSIQIAFTVFGVEWLFTIYEDFLYITIRSIIFQVISFFLLFIFVRKSNDYLNYAAITVFSSVGSNVLNFLRAKKILRIRLIWKFNWRIHIVPIMILFASNIANLIYMNSDITMLGIMKNNYIVGIYTISSRIYSIVKIVISAGLTATIPRLALLYGNKRMKEYDSILSNLVNSLLLIVLPSMTGMILLSKEIILIISGPNFLRSVLSLRTLTCAYLFSIMAYILNDCVLIPAKREKKVLISMTISALLNIVINIILIPYLSENAAALSTIVAELCVFSLNLYFAKDIAGKVFISKELLKNFIEGIIGCLLIVVVCFICHNEFSSIVGITISSVSFSVIVYFILLIAVKNQIITGLMSKVSRKRY